MSYTRPSATAVNFRFSGGAYTRPGSTAVNFRFPNDAVSGTGAATLGITAAASGLHYETATIGGGAAVLVLAAVGVGAHGVVGASSISLALGVAADGKTGVVGAATAALGLSGAAVALHPRFNLKGEVRFGGILVERRVRVYRRDTGALVGEQDTSGGHFNMPVGFAQREHYVVPVDMSDAATDWLPPTANRVLSILVVDA